MDNLKQFDQETALINRICGGDENALERLYQQYYQRLFRFIGRTVWHEELIDEIINDVMYTVWEKASTYNHQCQLSTWIFGIAYNKSRQALRDSGRIKEDSLEDLDGNDKAFNINDKALKQLENREWIDSILKILSPEQRAVMELTYFDGLSYSEIATIMDCPESTVKTRMHYARKILAMHLNNENEAM